MPLRLLFETPMGWSLLLLFALLLLSGALVGYNIANWVRRYRRGTSGRWPFNE